LELFRFLQTKLQSRSFLNQKLSPSTAAHSGGGDSNPYWNIDLHFEVGQAINPQRGFSIRRSINDNLTREIRSRVQSEDTSVILTLNFLLSDPNISEDIKNIFLSSLKIFYDSIGLYFQPPHQTTDSQGKHYLVFDALIQPPEGANEFLDLLDPQNIDIRLDVDTTSETLGASFQVNTSFSKSICNLPIFQMDEKMKSFLSMGKDLSIKLKVQSLSDISNLLFFQELIKDSGEEFKVLFDQIIHNQDLSAIMNNFLQQFYNFLKNSNQLGKHEYALYQCYPLITKHLDTLKSVTLIIKNQVLCLDINFPGLLKRLPEPTLENLEDFAKIPQSPVNQSLNV